MLLRMFPCGLFGMCLRPKLGVAALALTAYPVGAQICQLRPFLWTRYRHPVSVYDSLVRQQADVRRNPTRECRQGSSGQGKAGAISLIESHDRLKSRGASSGVTDILNKYIHKCIRNYNHFIRRHHHLLVARCL